MNTTELQNFCFAFVSLPLMHSHFVFIFSYLLPRTFEPKARLTEPEVLEQITRAIEERGHDPLDTN